MLVQETVDAERLDALVSELKGAKRLGREGDETARLTIEEIASIAMHDHYSDKVREKATAVLKRQAADHDTLPTMISTYASISLIRLSFKTWRF